MQEAVGLRRESRDDVAVLAGFQVVGNDLADEVKGFGGGVGVCHIKKFLKELPDGENALIERIIPLINQHAVFAALCFLQKVKD
ncbi:MAG: hypothetical protein D3916_09465 [Candidatus Electrothrix sp. MAN1_4]|nr:hypothetical protein [Candidatus Electrothrix sp. MAN1_4]